MDAADILLSCGSKLQDGRHTFVVDRVLGKGGFGITYRGRETVSGREVAIKEYYPDICHPCRMTGGTIVPLPKFQAIYNQGKKSFMNEAAMLKALDDIPSAVRILAYFEANGTAYMVMEFLNGQTLRSMVEKNGPIPMGELMPRMLPLMRDISAMHERGVLHRDIAPDNIMWMPDGTLKLLDFGCARAVEDGKSMTVQLKPGFAPLEQYQTHGQGDYTDIYALCASIYFCITGLVPPASPERVFAMDGNSPDPLPWPKSLNIQIPEELEYLLMWGLSVYPSTRPQTMKQLTDRIECIRLPEKGKTKKKPGPVSLFSKSSGSVTIPRIVVLGFCVAAGIAVCAFLIYLLL